MGIEAPLRGWLTRAMLESDGMSYEKESASVSCFMAEWSATVTTISRSMKMPPAGLQSMDESEPQRVRSQSVPPIRIFGHESTI